MIESAILGLIAGALAKFVMPGKDPGGIIVTILLGIAGASVGGFLARTFLGLEGSGINITNILISAAGAFLLLLLYRVFLGRRRNR